MRRFLVVFWLHGSKPKAVTYQVRAGTRTDALLSVSGHVALTFGRARVRGAQVMELVELWPAKERVR